MHENTYSTVVVHSDEDDGKATATATRQYHHDSASVRVSNKPTSFRYGLGNRIYVQYSRDGEKVDHLRLWFVGNAARCPYHHPVVGQYSESS